PLTKFCQASAAGEQEVIPAPKKRTYKDIQAVVGVVENRGRILIQKRPEKGLFAGLWEFPGGKVESGESPEQALERELQEELGTALEAKSLLLSIRHAYTQYRVRLYAYLCRLRGKPKPKTRNHRWVKPENLRRYPFPSGSTRIVRVLEDRAGLKNPWISGKKT
ncbi:MAG: (deoxy)nucleoside triphosphate pyrophosphohydrolase, partial [Candidatus Aminicenantales bacterium]